MDKSKYGVHQTHCCLLHGCKYGDEGCPVVLKIIEQKYPCEDCDIQEIKDNQNLKKVLAGEHKQCPNCGHIV